MAKQSVQTRLPKFDGKNGVADQGPQCLKQQEEHMPHLFDAPTAILQSIKA
jgi:hypothetical protein